MTNLSKKLFEKAYKHRGVMEMCLEMSESYQQFEDVDDSYIRLINNNCKIGIGIYSTIDLLNRPRGGSKMFFVNKLADAGDPLALELQAFTYEVFKRGGNPEVDGLLKRSDVVDLLVSRKMTEKQYNDYLNGIKPIAHFDGKDYILQDSCELEKESR